MRRLAALAVVALALPLAAGCGSSSSANAVDKDKEKEMMEKMTKGMKDSKGMNMPGPGGTGKQ